jgi:O-antigen/teichoic acid export membrane protein
LWKRFSVSTANPPAPEPQPGTKARAVKGVLWNSASFYIGKLFVLISTVILARLLSQDDFGVAGYAIVVISVLDVLSDLGVGASLIYYRDDPEARDTAFWLGMAISLLLLAALWIAAPLMGAFFNDPRAVAVIRALAFFFPLSALGNIQNSLLSKELSFSRKFIPDLTRSFSKGLISIFLAILGLGAWSLIIGQLASALIASIVLWWIYPWRPTFRLVLQWVGRLLGYGGKSVTVAVLGTFIGNTDYLLIGRFLGAEALGIYTLAFRIPDMLITQLCSLVSHVTFPLFSKLQDDADALVEGFLTTTRYIALLTLPIGLGIALVALPLVLVVFGEKWAASVPVLRAIALYSVFQSLFYSAGIIYKAQGRPELSSYLAILHLALLIPGVLWAVTGPRSITAVGLVLALVMFIIGIVEIFIAGKMLKTSLYRIGMAAAPAIVHAGIMSIVVLLVLFHFKNALPFVQLSVGILSGLLSYSLSLWLLRRDLVLNGIRTLREGLRR